MKMNNDVFKIIDDGKEIECDVLFTFASDETGKDYIVYTDNTLDEEGNTKVYAASYAPSAEKPMLVPIESEKEWNNIELLLETLQNKKIDEIEGWKA